MTRTANARIAGFTYLFYAAIGICLEILMHRARSVDGDSAAKLARIGEHATDVRIAILITLLECFSALVLAVTLYGITRDQDRDLAVLALSCRVSEGVIAAMAATLKMGLLSVATASVAAAAPDAAAAQALGALLLKEGSSSTLIGATCFAIGSTIFAYLFLRARSIPVWLAWIGVLGSALLVVGLPLQLAGFLGGPVSDVMWIPVAVFEVVLGFWLLIKGVAGQATR